MKKARKFLAIALAVVMLSVMLPMTVLADESTDTGEGGTLVPTVTYNQKKVATLPTSEAFAFIIDPQGLYYLSDEEIKALVVESGELRRLGEMGITKACDEPDCIVHETGDKDKPCNEETAWKLLDSAGQIIFSTYHPWFTNMSNHEIALSVNFSFTDGDEEEDVIAVDDPEDVICEGDDCCDLCDDDLDPVAALFIGATFSTANVDGKPEAFSGRLTLPVLADARAPLFILGAADYEDETNITRVGGVPTSILVEMRKNIAEDAKGHGTQFMLTGRCNPNADWHAVDTNTDLALGIKIVFTLTAPAPSPPAEWTLTAAQMTSLTAGAAIGDAYGLRATTALPATDYILRGTPLTADFDEACEWCDEDPCECAIGFLGASPITPTARAITVEAGEGNVAIPFNFDGANIASVQIVEWTFDITADFTKTDDQTLTWNVTSVWDGLEGTYTLRITLDNSGVFNLTGTITPA